MTIIYYLTPDTYNSRTYSTHTYLIILIGLFLLIGLILLFTKFNTSLSHKTKSFFDIVPTRGIQTLNTFRIFVAPASGPRCFTTMGFDRQFRKSQIDSRSKWFVGGSTAALRFTALIAGLILNKNISKHIQHIFTEMTYQHGDSPDTLSPMMEKLIQACAPKSILSEIVHHPYLHLCIFVARLKYTTDISDWRLKLSFGGMYMTNLVYPQGLDYFYDTCCFYTGNSPPPLISKTHICFEPITVENFYDVLQATTCIPFVSKRATQIGKHSGLFFDGAICHYHLNLICNQPEYPTLYLSDQFVDSQLKANVFDSWVPWRGIPEQDLKYCTRIHPTTFFQSQIPENRFPTVSDWFDTCYVQNPKRRKRSWLKAYKLSIKKWLE